MIIEEGDTAYEWGDEWGGELWLPLGKTIVEGAAYGSNNRLYKITAEKEIFR